MKRWLLFILPVVVLVSLIGVYFHLRTLYHTQFENQFPRLNECAIKARQVKEKGLILANETKFDGAMAVLANARDFYEYCGRFFPTGLSAFFNSSAELSEARKDYFIDFSDLFYQFALIQQADENPKPDLDLSIGAMERALEAIKTACAIGSDNYCVARQQSYYTILGDAYRIKKDYGRSFTMFEQANDVKPDDPINLSFWGLALFEGGKKEAAMKKWQLAVAKDSNAPAKEMMNQYKP